MHKNGKNVYIYWTDRQSNIPNLPKFAYADRLERDVSQDQLTARHFSAGRTQRRPYQVAVEHCHTNSRSVVSQKIRRSVIAANDAEKTDSGPLESYIFASSSSIKSFKVGGGSLESVNSFRLL